MCQRELGAGWCRAPFEDVISRVLAIDAPDDDADEKQKGAGAAPVALPHANRRALRRQPHLKRMLLMGHYAAHLPSG